MDERVGTERRDDAIDFFYDVVSPYSYLAAVRIEDVASDLGRATRWRPILLPAIFQGAENPTPVTIQAKARWIVQDLGILAEMNGVPMNLPSQFPVRSLTALRAVLAAGEQGGEPAKRRASLALFSAYWVGDVDIALSEEVARVLDAAGMDGGRLVERTSEPSIKAALIANGEEALARGVFGAPTFFVDGQMFFGHDRLDALAYYVRRGEEPVQ